MFVTCCWWRTASYERLCAMHGCRLAKYEAEISIIGPMFGIFVLLICWKHVGSGFCCLFAIVCYRSEGRSSRGISSPGGGLTRIRCFRVVSCRCRRRVPKIKKSANFCTRRAPKTRNPKNRQKSTKIKMSRMI